MKNRPSGEVLWLTRYLEGVSSLKEHRKGKFLFHQSRVTDIVFRYRATSVLRCFLTSLKKLFPCGIAPPKFSAIVCPMSASVSRTPRFTPVPSPGEYAKIGTYSREWSAVALIFSLPSTLPFVVTNSSTPRPL